MEPPDRPPWYPVVLDLSGRPCLVVGGGPVALHKAGGLAACGADVTVVAPRLEARFAALPVATEARPYRAGEAAGYRLVVTATGVPEVDAAVAADAEAAGVWVNSADDPQHCTAILPSVHRDGPVIVAVSTGGASPALAGWLRRRAGEALGPGLGALAGLLGAARRAVVAQGRASAEVDWAALLDGPLPDVVRAGDLAEARRLLDAATAEGSTAEGSTVTGAPP